MGLHKGQKTGAIVLRIVLFADLLAIMIYGAITPKEMNKVVAEVVTISIAAVAMAIQVYVTLAVYTRLFYAIWLVAGLDGICSAAWVTAIAVLSYWSYDVVYRPHDGDPDAWFQCANATNWDEVLTSNESGHWLHVEWCKVKVNGQQRLIGNGAAIQQLNVLIGLSVVSLLFTGFILLRTLIVWRRRR